MNKEKKNSVMRPSEAFAWSSSFQPSDIVWIGAIGYVSLQRTRRTAKILIGQPHTNGTWIAVHIQGEGGVVDKCLFPLGPWIGEVDCRGIGKYPVKLSHISHEDFRWCAQAKGSPRMSAPPDTARLVKAIHDYISVWE